MPPSATTNALLTDEALRAATYALNPGNGALEGGKIALNHLVHYHATRGREALVNEVAQTLGRHTNRGTPYVGPFNVEDWKPLAEVVVTALVGKPAPGRPPARPGGNPEPTSRFGWP